MTRLLAALLLVGVLASPAAAAPLGAGPEDVANRMSGEIMSPFCPGVTLHECPSQEATDLRDRIEGWAAAGWSEERIMNELVAQYGDGIRAVPPSDGGGIVAWLLPGVVAVGGALFAGTLARRWTRQRERDRAGEDLEARRSITPEQRRRLAGELAALEARSAGQGRRL